NPPVGEEARVFGGHHSVREVIRDLGQGHVLIPPWHLPAGPPGFDAALELHHGEGRGDDPPRAEPQEAQAIEAQHQAEAYPQHPAEMPAPTHVESSCLPRAPRIGMTHARLALQEQRLHGMRTTTEQRPVVSLSDHRDRSASRPRKAIMLHYLLYLSPACSGGAVLAL